MRKKLQSKRKTLTNSIRFSAGLFALTLLGQVYHGFNYAYFVDSGLLDVFLATVCKIVFTIVDSLNDIIFGILSEKTKSRWGKRLPWLVGGTPFFLFFVVFCYFPQASWGWNTINVFIYYLLFSIMIENCSTVLYINYNAIFPVAFRTQEERTVTASFRKLFELIAMGVCFIITPMLTSNGLTLFHVGLIYGAIYLVIMIYSITGIRIDKTKENVDIRTDTRYSFKNTLLDVIHNKPFLVYNITHSFFTAVLGILVSIYPMYCKYVLKTNSFFNGILMGVLFGSLILSIPLWNIIVRKIGYRRAYKISYTCLPFALFSLTFPNNWWQAMIILLIVGPSIGGLLLTPDLMSTELIDIDKMKHGISREASFASIGSLLNRISLVISAIVMAITSYALGYKSGSEPGNNPELAFRMLVGVMLAVVSGIGTLCCYYYIKISKEDSDKLKEHNKKLEERIEEPAVSTDSNKK